MLSIRMRVPCRVHANCDETHMRLMHSSAKKYKDLTDAEKANGGHDFCEGDLPKIRKALLSEGKWTCSCGQVHTYDKETKNVTPNLIQLWDSIEAS